MDTPTLNASSRTIVGKQVKQLRNQGQLPAVVYGHDRKSTPLSINALEYERVFNTAGTSTLVDLMIDDAKPVKVLLHEPQLHPVKPMAVHADLYVVKMNEKLQTEIPLEFVGDAEAVSVLEGTLNVVLDALTVECFPDKLVPVIEVDITSLKTFDDILRISDIKLPDGLEVLADPEEVIATITAPRSEEELAELEEAPVGEDADKAAMEAVEVTGEKPADAEEKAEE
jgi:large subunit ribosomal protein L25